MDNQTAKGLKLAAKCTWFLGVVTAVYLGFKLNGNEETFSFLAAAAAAAGSLLLGLFAYAIGEIITILHDIRANTAGQNEIIRTETPKPEMYVEDMSASDAAPNTADGSLALVDSFIWICSACGEINLASNDHCRICKAEK